MKISKTEGARAIINALDCMCEEMQIRLYRALTHYLIDGAKITGNFDNEEKGFFELILNLIDDLKDETNA